MTTEWKLLVPGCEKEEAKGGNFARKKDDEMKVGDFFKGHGEKG